MKLTLLLTTFLLIFSSLRAQITYQSSDYAGVGEHYLVSTNLFSFTSNFSETGENFEWDFSNLLATQQDALEYVDPDDAGYFVPFYAQCVLQTGGIFSCNGDWNNLTNLAYKLLDSLVLAGYEFRDVVSHLKKTNTTLEETMLGLRYGNEQVQPPLAIVYDNADTIYRFPIQYQNRDSSRMNFSIDLRDLNIQFAYTANRKRVNRVDGWGKLTTPLGTFENTLRMRTVLTINDEAIVNGQEVTVPGVQQVTYSWFDKDYGTPVLVAEGILAGSSEIILRVRYIDVRRCVGPTALFYYLPPIAIFNPEVGAVNYEFTNISQNAETYIWNFGDGTTSAEKNPKHTYTQAGTYSVQLIACNTTCEPAACDTLQLPLVIIDTTSTVNANFSIMPDNRICPGDTLRFENFSENADRFYWNFGNGDTATVQNPVYVYPESGSYEVQLIAANFLRQDTFSRIVTVAELPQPFLGNDTTLTNLDTLLLYPGEFETYLWSTASADTALVVIGATLQRDTTFTVMVTNAAGCVGVDSIRIQYEFVSATDAPELTPVLLFPNPATEKLYLRGLPQQENIQLSILTLTGQAVGRFANRECEQGISVAHLPAGIYLVKVQSERGERTLKFVKR